MRSWLNLLFCACIGLGLGACSGGSAADADASLAEPRLFAPAQATRVRKSQNKDTPLPPEEPVGENPPTGAVFDYWLADQYPSEEDLAAVRVGRAAAPMGKPRVASEVTLPAP